jgi:ADP-heptose:LPS heptosyltransferase
MGENMFKLPLLVALTELFPRARIAWVPGIGGPFFLETHLAPLVGGRIHEFIADLAIPSDLRRSLLYWHPILKRRFDLVIDTQRNFGRSLFLKRIPHRLFISGVWRYALSDRKPPRGISRHPPRLVDKLLGLAAAAAARPVAVANPLPVPPAWRDRAAKLLPAGPVYIGLAPGVGDMAHKRDWPFDNFMAVGRAQSAQGRAPVVILGPAERQWADKVRAALPQALIPDLAGDGTTPAGPTLTVALAARLSAAVANDAGAGHLLAAGGAPMVSLFGWSRPAKRAPFARAIEIVRAQDFGSEDIAAIPQQAVLAAVERLAALGPVLRD